MMKICIPNYIIILIIISISKEHGLYSFSFEAKMEILYNEKKVAHSRTTFFIL